MLNIGTISVFPGMFDALNMGMPARAVAQDALHLHHWSLRDFADNKHGSIDDTPYGGGPGMVLKVAPVRAAIQAAKTQLGNDTPVYYLSPQGRPVDQATLSKLCQKPGMILLAGRYEGIDERLQQDIDEELSIGDYVLSGGELAAMVLIDAMARLLPGVLGDAESAAQDSFSDGLLDYPHYTRPASIDAQTVPAVLQNGDHQAIAQWRRMQALGRTWQRRPDLLKQQTLSSTDQQLLEDFLCQPTKEGEMR
jgi:tRNA (guanine37-N1)-methyltransferase